MEHSATVISQRSEGLARGVISAAGVPRGSDLHLAVNQHLSSSRSGTVVSIPQLRNEVNQAGAVISKIEAIFESMVDALASGASELSLPYRTRTTRARLRTQNEDGDSAGTTPDGVVTFPGRTIQEAKKFAAVLHILQISREAIAKGALITKRNIFYQNAGLFRQQRVVDSLVDDLAYTLGVGRDDLNIVAAAKGLVAGPITLTMSNNSVVPCGLAHESGTLIPTPKLIRKIDFGLTQWILVIEKEATFRTLAAAGYHTTSLAGPGILLTGKGFPDLATRSFLNTIHSVRLQLPIYALVDYDPDGISIMRTYRLGSSSLRHEENIATPQIRWLGIRSDQILRWKQATPHWRSVQSNPDADINIHQATQTVPDTLQHDPNDSGLSQPSSTHCTAPSGSAPLEALSQLRARDRRMAVNLLQSMSQETSNDTDETEQVRELQVMLMLNYKAEIQAVDNLGDITNWLDARLSGSGVASMHTCI